jgi:hypothetical protein
VCLPHPVIWLHSSMNVFHCCLIADSTLSWIHRGALLCRQACDRSTLSSMCSGQGIRAILVHTQRSHGCPPWPARRERVFRMQALCAQSAVDRLLSVGATSDNPPAAFRDARARGQVVDQPLPTAVSHCARHTLMLSSACADCSSSRCACNTTVWLSSSVSNWPSYCVWSA